MPVVRSIQGKAPEIGEGTWLSETAVVVGDVVLGEDCSVWYNAVVRGDVNSIRIGNKTNIQDGAIIHCTYQKASTTIGNSVSIGHNAIIHGCVLQDKCLVGMGAIVMDNCVVETGAVVAAGAVVSTGTVVKSGMIYAGIPAKPLKEISEELRVALLEKTPENYVLYKSWFVDTGF